MTDVTPQTDATEKDIADLKKLLLDSHHLDRLASFRNEVNVFDVLRIANTEIRHSNILSWLFDPSENHGLGDAVVKRLIQWFVNEHDDANNYINLLLMDNDSFIVMREFHNIDIMLLSSEGKVVICIENKIYSGEHGNQLERYKGIIEDLYPSEKGYIHCFIFLSIYGDEATHVSWKSLGYETIVGIIENAIAHRTISPDTSLIILHYLSTIRRITMGNQEVINLCNEIYRKHRHALDLIYENRADITSSIVPIIHDWLDEWSKQGKIIFDRNGSGSKSWITFHTSAMDKIIIPEIELTDENKSGWGNKYHYQYAVANRPIPSRILCEFSSKGLSGDNLDKITRIQSLFLNYKLSDNWQWNRIEGWNLKKRKIDSIDDFDEQTVQAIHDEIENIITNKIPEFEARVRKSLSEE